LDGNHNINNIPRDKNRENKTANTNTDDYVANIASTNNDFDKISIADNYLENLEPSLRNSIDDITAIINTNLGNYDISSKHKASIQTQIEGLANLIKSIPRKTNNAIIPDDSAYSNNDDQKPVSSLDQTDEINPQYADAYNNKGLSLYYLGNNQEAIACYDKAIEINPYYADAFYNKGMALSATSKFAEAISSFDKAIEINPYYADAFYNKGMALSATSKFAEAIFSYEKTLEIDSDNVKALNGKSWILANQYPARIDEALETIKRALGIDPTDIDVLYTYGFIMEHMGSYKESVSIYNHILKQDPLIPEVWYRCFVSKTKSDDDELPDSAFYLNQAIDLNPEYAMMSTIERQKKISGNEKHYSIPIM
jgi:tetratricopeptide (TPR) repeat protein